MVLNIETLYHEHRNKSAPIKPCRICTQSLTWHGSKLCECFACFYIVDSKKAFSLNLQILCIPCQQSFLRKVVENGDQRTFQQFAIVVNLSCKIGVLIVASSQNYFLTRSKHCVYIVPTPHFKFMITSSCLFKKISGFLHCSMYSFLDLVHGRQVALVIQNTIAVYGSECNNAGCNLPLNMYWQIWFEML